MASVNVPVVTFQGGIIGDELQNRVDIPTYPQGAEIVENFRATVQGVMMRRPPMMHVDEFTDHTKQGQLFPFIYSVDESYLVLATEDGFTFYDDDGVITNPTVTASITAAANFTDLADAATITASSTGSGSTSNLVDEDSSTVWASSAAVSEYLNFDMGSATTLRSIWLTAPTTGANEAPTTFTVKGSATGAFAGEEVTLLTVTGTTWTAGRRRKWSFTATGSYRYYRLGMTANGGGASFTLCEVSLFSGSWMDKSETPSGVSIVGSNLVLDGDGGNTSILEVPITINETDVRHVLAFEIVHGPLDVRIGTTADGYDLLNYKEMRTGVHRLSFTPTTSTVYLQFRHSSMAGRWLKNNVSIVSGGGTFVLPCPYLEEDLPEVHVQQIKDVMYMTHEDYWPRRLERRGASSWSITQNMPIDGPFEDLNTTDIQVTPSDTHGEISLTSTAPLFTSDDPGRLFYISSPGVTVRKVLNNVTADTVTDGIKVTGGPSTRLFNVKITGSFVGTVRLQRSSGNENGYTDDAVIGPWSGVTNNNVDDNRQNETLYYRLIVKPADYTSGTITMQLYYAHASSEGVVRVLEYVSPTEVLCEVLSPLGSTASTKNWKKGDWCVENGFPVSVSEGYGRLWFARGTRVWASRSDNFTNFKTVTDEADSAFNRNIATPSNDGIKWLAMLGQLAIGTSSMEKLGLGNTNADPIGPSNFQFLPGTEEGGASIQPVVAAGSILFVHRAKRQLMQFTANPKALSETSYISVDLTARAPEVLNDEIVDIAIQREPERRIYVVLRNGRLMELLFRREGDVDVVAWSAVPTQGRVERVAVLPRDNEDVAYFIVRRQAADGSWERHIERFGRERVLMDCDRFHLDSALAYALTKPDTTAEPSATTGSITIKTDDDAFVVGDVGKVLWINGGRGTITAYTNAKTVTMTVTTDLDNDDPCPAERWGFNSTTSTLTGLDHLEGQSVRVYGDMTDLGDYTVSSGSVTLSQPVSVAYAGLTFRSRWKSLKLSYGAQKGTALGMRKAIKAIVAMLYRCGPTVTYGKALGRGLSRSFTKMREISTRDAAVPLGEPLPLFSGEKELSFDAHYDTDSRICLEIEGPAPGTIAGLTLILDEKDR